MPTWNELRSQIADEVGLDTTADTAVLDRALNRALRRIVSETGCLKGTLTVTGDAATIAVSLAAATTLLEVDSVHTVVSGAYSPIPRVPHTSILDARPQSAVSMYCYEGGALLLDGPVGLGTDLYVRYTGSPTALAAGATEAAIVALGIPAAFHEDVLAGIAMTQLLEGYEGDEQRAAYYRGLSGDALQRFKRHLQQRGGDEAANARFGAPHFHTPAPLAGR